MSCSEGRRGFADDTSFAPRPKSSYEGHAIQKDRATNHIRGDCVGSKLTLYVNDAKVLKVDNSELDGPGQVGLFVEDTGLKPPGTSVLFDDFRPSAP